jgi:hypothetical protein
MIDPVPCEIADDGVTVTRIETTFLDRLPDNFTQAGTKLTHAGEGHRCCMAVGARRGRAGDGGAAG